MELWIDTSQLDAVEQATRLGILTGVTTNPSIVAASSLEPELLIRQLLEIQPGWVAVQVLTRETEEMIKQARALHAISSRLVIKIPVIQSGLTAIHLLSQEGVPTLATAIFETRQALLAFRAGAHYLAPYLGRVADCGQDPLRLLAEIREIKASYAFSGKVMAAGIRDLSLALNCVSSGVDAMTLPHSVFADFVADSSHTLAALERFEADTASRVPYTQPVSRPTFSSLVPSLP